MFLQFSVHTDTHACANDKQLHFGKARKQ